MIVIHGFEQLPIISREKSRSRTERTTGNRAESDPAKSTGNGLDAWLHLVFCAQMNLTSEMWTIEQQMLESRKNREQQKKGKKKKRKLTFLLMNKRNFIFPFLVLRVFFSSLFPGSNGFSLQICQLSQQEQCRRKKKEKKEQIRTRTEAQRRKFLSVAFSSESSLTLLLSRALDQENMCSRGMNTEVAHTQQWERTREKTEKIEKAEQTTIEAIVIVIVMKYSSFASSTSLALFEVCLVQENADVEHRHEKRSE